MSINIGGGELRELKPRILVLGVGGAGGNAINAMIESGMEGVEFVAVNTDAQDLKMSKAHAKIQIGMNLTKGLGAGAKHDIGQAAADESLNEITSYIQGANMVFITSGMGGGTGTGASHVIARAARELNILTVGVTTLPFSYEGPKRMRRAIEGLEEFKKHLDTVIVVPNNVLKHGVQSVTDLMVRPGMINLDFADVETVMSAMGKAMMGTGEAEGENRAMAATEIALNNPLIDEYSLQGAKGLLINITGGNDLTLFEVDQSVNKIRAEVDPEAELIFGAIKDENMTGKIRVSIVATALDGYKTENKTVLNMVSRIQNRNTGYSENLFSQSPRRDSNTLSSIDGATALKLDESFELPQEEQNNSIENMENNELNVSATGTGEVLTNIPEGVSIESTSYMENNNFNENESVEAASENEDLESTPKLFSDEQSYQTEETDSQENNQSEQLFDQDINEDEDFEIPAFLRKQKF